MGRIHTDTRGIQHHVGGRKRSSPAKRRLIPHLPHYVTRMADLPTPPALLDLRAKATTALLQVYLNDAEGDCVIAGYYHAKGVLTGNATGTPFIATDAQINGDYGAIGGYVVGDPSTDNGCDMVTAIQYWMATGDQGGTKLAGAVSLDATNVPLMQLALFLFSNLYLGFEIPDSGINPFPSAGDVWNLTGAPDPSNGHCIESVGYAAPGTPAIVGYTVDGILVCTWGEIVLIPWAAVSEYFADANGGEAYALFSPDELAAGMSACPNGIDWGSLQADLAAIGTPVPASPDATLAP
jgi:hypothetical protein